MIKVNKIAVPKKEKYVITSEKIISFIGSDFFAIMISVFLTILQSFHPAKVLVSFEIFSNQIANNLFCYLMTFFIELFVLYYVIRKEVKISKGFMIFSIIINIYYYADKFHDFNNFVFDTRMIPALAFSIAIPYSIYKVSDQIRYRDEE